MAIVGLVAIGSAWFAIKGSHAAVAPSPSAEPPASPSLENGIQQLGDQVQLQLAARNFEALESSYQQIRTGDGNFTGGIPRLYVFYRALALQPVEGYHWRDYTFDVVPDAAFEQRRALLEAWRKAKPYSNAPRVSLALLWRNYAWQARGHDEVDHTSRAQFQGFAERLIKEAGVLYNVPRTDPEVYETLLSLARDLGARRPQLDALYREAVAKYPGYLPIYVLRANVLQPKWYGAPGELKEYADSLLQEPGGDLGRMTYSLVAVQQFNVYAFAELFKKTELNWPDVKSGFELRERLYGFSNDDWNMYLYLACAAGDRATAKEAAQHVGEWIPFIWQEKHWFDQDVAWARS
ncbi:DUF4034 domain-containing protein [Bradyrhizobium sp. Arg314]